MDQFDLWQVVPRQVYTPYSPLFISCAWHWLSRGNWCINKILTCSSCLFQIIPDYYNDVIQNNIIIEAGLETQWDGLGTRM